MKPLTAKQAAVFGFLRAYIAENGRAPSFFEISHNFGWASDNAAHEHITALIRKGFVNPAHGAARGISIVGERTPDPAKMAKALRAIRDRCEAICSTGAAIEIAALCDAGLA